MNIHHQRLRGRSIYPIVALAIATGMRRGELLALRWKDIDTDGARLRVERSLEQTKKNGLVFKSPKTKHGRRTICLPASTRTARAGRPSRSNGWRSAAASHP